ncbi:MAG: PKD domain-containing protein [Acidobacteriaceae bacterium]
MLRCLLLLLAFASLCVSVLSQSFTFSPTTTLGSETANNTSAADSFAGQTNGNAATANTSKLPTRNLLYQGSSTLVYAHFMPWFGQSNHISVGYNSDDATQVKKQVDDMMSRGIQGAVIDWYGPNHTVENGTTLLMKSEAETRGGQFVFAVMEDVGALKSCANTSGCDVTQQLISDLTYVYNTYETSPAYMTSGGHPLVYFFGVDVYTIDWTRVRQSIPGDPYFIFQGLSGFTHPYSSGSFSWIQPNASNPDDEGLSYLDSFYNTAQNYPNYLTIGSAYPGFNNSLAPWLGSNTPKIMKQHCGQTWIDSLGRTGNHYSTSNQLYAIQLVTWNDYEEGTEIESGIDNCIAVSASTSGATLNWSLSGAGKENTIDHYTVLISNDGQNLMPLTNAPSGTHSYDFSQLNLAPGTNWYFFVEAVGVPSIHNQISGAVSYQASSDQPPVASLSVTPTSGTLPLQVTADASGSSDPDGTIASYSINFGDGTATSGPLASHTYYSAGTFTVKATVTDNLGATSSATKTVVVSVPPCTPGTVNRTVTICQPGAGATVSSPVQVVAAATDTSTVQYMQVYVDGAKKFQQNGTKQISTSLAISLGSHTITVQAKDKQGTFKQTITITVQ